MKVWPLQKPDVPLISSYILVQHMVHSHRKVYYKSQICHQQRSKSFPFEQGTIPKKQKTPFQQEQPNKVSQRSSAIPSNGNGDAEKQLCRQILWLEQLPAHGGGELQQNSTYSPSSPAHCRSLANTCVYYSRSVPATSQFSPREKCCPALPLTHSTFRSPMDSPLVPNTSNST